MDRKQPPKAAPKRRQITLAEANAEMRRVQLEARAWRDLHFWLRHIVEHTARGQLF